MNRHDRQRLEDILAAIDAIRAHLTRGELSDALVFDVVRVRLIEIGEGVTGVAVGDHDGALAVLERVRPRGRHLWCDLQWTGLDPLRATPRFRRIMTASAFGASRLYASRRVSSMSS